MNRKTKQSLTMHRRNVVILLFVVVVLVAALHVTYQLKERVHVTTPPQSKNYSSVPRDAISCTKTLTPEVKDGSHYLKGSHDKNDFTFDGKKGKPIVLTGYVVDTDCKPIIHAWLDFWQADANGKYDDTNFSLRGHQFTDEHGQYSLSTIIPGDTSRGMSFFNVLLKKNDSSPVLSTRIFIPVNGTADPQVQKDLTAKVSKSGTTAVYTFVIKR